jgi:ABC-2 type transport system ATP-binding protein
VGSGDAALELRSVSKRYRGGGGVEDVDLDVRYDEVHALVGLNGAGKTTALRLLLGMLRPDSGRCLLDGRDVRAAPSGSWRRVGHLLGPARAYDVLSVAENLEVTGRLAGLGRRAARAAARSGAESIGLTPWWRTRAGALSSGNRQRLRLAALLIGEPDILVLDEPTTALDPVGVLLVRQTLREASGRSGTAVLLSSHQLDEVARIATRVTMIHEGAIVGALDPGGDLEQQLFSRLPERTSLP